MGVMVLQGCTLDSGSTSVGSFCLFIPFDTLSLIFAHLQYEIQLALRYTSWSMMACDISWEDKGLENKALLHHGYLSLRLLSHSYAVLYRG